MFGSFDPLGEDIDDVLDENRDVLDIAEAMHFDCLVHSETRTKVRKKLTSWPGVYILVVCRFLGPPLKPKKTKPLAVFGPPPGAV